MPEETKSEIKQEKENIAVVKSTRKSTIFSRITDKLPRINKKLFILLLIILVIPLTIALSLAQQELRSRASGVEDRKVFLGINNGLANVDRPLEWVQSDVERIKRETGSYPAAYVLWANFSSNSPKLEVLQYLDSKGITPVISLMPKPNDDFDNRRDGRFILSAPSASDSVEPGKIKFNSSVPSSISKIYVSKTSSGTENPAKTLAPTWVPGGKIEIFGTNSGGKVDYESNNDFKFEILSKAESADYWVLSVRPLKTTPLTGMFSVNKPVFITPSDYLVKEYSNSEIARGSMDNKFLQFANVARQFNKPIIFRYAQEMNADYYPWTDSQRKAKDKTPYERYKFMDLGNRKGHFVASWKHIYSLVSNVAPKVEFFWNPHNTNLEEYSYYYPGNGYVDYVGFDGYSGSGDNAHRSIEVISSSAIAKLTSISNKPIIVGETGINSKHSNGVSGSFQDYRRNWLTNGYNYLANNPRVKGIFYFDVDMTGQQPNNWLMSQGPEITSVYRSLLLNPKFQGKLANQEITPTSPIKSVTPTPTRTPVQPAGLLPYGYHDSASCTNIAGWACDENNYDKSVTVKFYADAPAGEGKYLGSTIANGRREAAVGEQCGGKSNRGFSFSVPDSIKDGQSHKIYAYAVDDSDGSLSNRLNTSPKSVSCSGGAVSSTPTPQDAPSCRRVMPTVTYIDTFKSGKKGDTVVYKINFKNNDVGCGTRKAVLDLSLPTERWSFTPETVSVNSGETKTINLRVTSGQYATPGTKSLNLTISGAYKPNTVFSNQVLQYSVVR